VQVHEKRKHSTKNNELQNNQINNKGIKIEDGPILCIKKTAHMGTIRNHSSSVLQKRSCQDYNVQAAQS
jgi:hypothetical protein